MRGRAPRQRERRPKTAGRGQELLGPAWPGVQASLRGDQPDATQGITKAARGLGGRYPRYPGQLRADTQTLACEQVLQETLGGNAGQSAGWAPGSGVGEWPPAILPARCEQKASAQSCHPRSPRLFRAACRCHAQGCSQQVGAARWAPPLTPPLPSPQCPGPSGCTAARPQWAPRAAAEPWVRGHKELGRASAG